PNLASTERLLATGARAGIRRFLFVSSVGADPGSPNPYLASKGAAEDAVRSSGIEHAILRLSFVSELLPRIFGRWLVWTVMPGDGEQMLAPVRAEEVAGTLVAADDRAGSVSGTYSLTGEPATLSELARSVRPGLLLRARPGSRSARRLPLSPAAVEALASDRLPDAPDARAAFGPSPATPQTY
ncbi:MAG TPA: NAD(P)H-binding protein, partial [Actinomycetota bacterium]|nr:NAD(P)H-binding protein [Actinomycetota bacterium]